MIPTDNVEVAFRDVDVAILVGAMPRREGMLRKDLLRANARIFESQGKALDQFAKKTVKVGCREVATCTPAVSYPDLSLSGIETVNWHGTSA